MSRIDSSVKSLKSRIDHCLTFESESAFLDFRIFLL